MTVFDEIRAILQKHKENMPVIATAELLAVIDVAEEKQTYDVEKVVKQIQKKHCGRCRNILGILGAEVYCKEQKCQIEELCEIVRNGGM